MSLLWAGLVLGIAFGTAARAGRFCLLRGLRQAWMRGTDLSALQAWALALAVALVATQSLAWAGLLEAERAQVARAGFSVPAVGLGGVLFGLGMCLARSCGARALVLLGGGNLRALVVLISLGLAAQATLTGVLAPLREGLQALGQFEFPAATLPGLLSAQGLVSARLWATGLPVLLLLVFALRGGFLRQAPVEALAAAVIGLLVAAGWWVTAHLDVDPFDPAPPTSLSFIGPVAEALLYLQLAVGRPLSLGPVMMLGTLLGAVVTAWLMGDARLEGFESPRRMLSSAAGGLLMGFGGVLAVGCSIGQGVSGLSVLALASVPACTGIVLGASLGLGLESLIPSRKGI